jgi:putative hydrolases of HD superfamily
MIVTFSLVNELFRAFHIQRWNDRIRPMDLIEMDKHAHKMIIAYCLGKYEESAGNIFDWQEVIKGGIYELLRRIVISDIKSPIYREIKKNKDVFQKLNKYIFSELEPKIEDKVIKEEIEFFLLAEPAGYSLSSRILEAAHIYASYWEFQIIRHANPQSYQNIKIETELLNDLNSYKDIIGVNKLINNHTIKNFIDLCSQLRFQIRWAQIPRLPLTSVLGHSLLVACISYFFTRDLPNCPKRLYNNFFGGLFHDLPEAVTRDIISPVKSSSSDLDKLIKTLEKELAEKEIYPLIEEDWVEELRYFTQNEFANKVIVNKKVKDSKITINDVSLKYNEDKYSPLDGEIIRTTDHLAAFLEAWNSCHDGIKSEDLIIAAQKIQEDNYKKTIGNIPIKTLYQSFKLVY